MTTFTPIITSSLTASVTVPLTVMFCEKAVIEITSMAMTRQALIPPWERQRDLLISKIDFDIDKLIRVVI